MLTRKLENFVDMLIENDNNINEDKEIIVFGLVSAIEFVFNVITTIAIGFLFGMVMESVVFLMSFPFLRTYAGGYHCEKAINCYISSCGILVLVLGIVKFTPDEYMHILGITMLVVAIPIILKFAPAETPLKPLDVIEKKHYRKKVLVNLYIENAVIVIFLFNGMNNLSLVVCLVIMISSGLIICNKKSIKE